MTEIQIAALCLEAGYAVTRVIVWDNVPKFRRPSVVYYRAYVSSSENVTQATLTKYFTGSRLECTGHGTDDLGQYIVVRERTHIGSQELST